MITLTAINGKKFFVNPEMISIEEDVDISVYGKGTKAVVRIDGENHAVLETVAQIDALRKGPPNA